MDGVSVSVFKCLEPHTLTALGPHWLGHPCDTRRAPRDQGQGDVRQKFTSGLQSES